VKDDKNLEITIRPKNGSSLMLKTESSIDKAMWMKAFESQIVILGNKNMGKRVSPEDRALSIGSDGIVSIPSVMRKEEDKRTKKGQTMHSDGDISSSTSFDAVAAEFAAASAEAEAIDAKEFSLRD
jgi:hypothetical protein